MSVELHRSRAPARGSYGSGPPASRRGAAGSGDGVRCGRSGRALREAADGAKLLRKRSQQSRAAATIAQRTVRFPRRSSRRESFGAGRVSGDGSVLAGRGRACVKDSREFCAFGSAKAGAAFGSDPRRQRPIAQTYDPPFEVATRRKAAARLNFIGPSELFLMPVGGC